MDKRFFKYAFAIKFIILFFIFPFSTIKAADPTNDWNTTSSLPSPLSNSAGYNLNNKVFVVAGSTFTDYNTILFSSQNSTDGTLNQWQEAGNLPEEIYYHQLVNNGDYFYILGGENYPPPTSTNHTYFGKPNLDSTINWSPSLQLPYPRTEGGAIMLNNRIYYIGGMSESSDSIDVHADVYYSSINTSGELVGWNTTTPLNTAAGQPAYFIGAVETGKKIITIGGKHDENNRFSRAVFQADVNPTTGELGSWEETYPIPDNNGAYTTGYNSVGVVRVGEYIIAVGGAVSGGNQSKKVYYTKITPDGGIEPWETSVNDLPVASKEGEIQYLNGYLYYIGGYSNELGGYHNKVFFSKLDIQPESSPTPTPSPSPSPIMTPTPIPKPGLTLNVPDIKQYSSPWGISTYDHLKSNPLSISRWGCALTSATMILQYHGSSITPNTLNDWLKQNNGYTRNGGIIWNSISKYSKIDPNVPNLEFLYTNYSESILKNEIDNNRPAMVKLLNDTYGGNHFITVKGYDNNNILINDPANAANQNMSQANAFWGNSISIGKFVPSNTDLSYITLFIDNKMNIKVYDPNGTQIPQEYFHVDYPYLDPNNVTSQPTLDILKSFYFPKPPEGVYKVELLGQGSYQLDSYLYNIEGNLSKESVIGLMDQNSTEDLFIAFNRDSKSVILSGELINIFNLLGSYDKTLVFKKGVYNNIYYSLLNINKNILSNHKFIAKKLISLLQIYINVNKKQFEPNFYHELKSSLQVLYSSIDINKHPWFNYSILKKDKILDSFKHYSLEQKDIF